MSRWGRASIGAVTGAVIVIGASGCASATADRDETRRELIAEIGMTDAEATCVVDGVWALDDDDVRTELTEDVVDLDDEQEAQLRAVLRGCGVEA